MNMSETQRETLHNIRKKHLNVLAEGVRMVRESGAEPAVTAGVLADGFPDWEAGKTYALNEPFRYGGMVGFSRQAGLTAQAEYPPFSTGTESLYGVRPAPDADGIYPYVYNMAVVPEMLVRSNGAVYKCRQAANPLLYPPESVPALFEAI